MILKTKKYSYQGIKSYQWQKDEKILAFFFLTTDLYLWNKYFLFLLIDFLKEINYIYIK